MTKDEALRLALEALEVANSCVDGYYIPRGKTHLPEIELAITAIKEALAQPEQPKVRTGDCLLVGVCASEGHKIQPQRTWVGLTPACPQGLTEYACEVEGVNLVCFLEYTPDEEGSRDSRGLLGEPGTFENLELVNAYVKGTDVDIGHLLLQYLVDHITTTALEDFKNDDL
jgi:hypothetical protein